jgi:probable HAF family extracellular repeat protein
MQPRISANIIMVALFVALAIPAQLSAQDNPAHKPRHHHYKLIDMGTFGGPKSYLNGFEYAGPPQSLNNAGMLAGWADTSKLDPYCLSGNSNGNFCFNYDQPSSCIGNIGCPGHVSHAFQWSDGVRTDLGALPHGLSSATAWISANGLIAGASQNGETDPLDPGLPGDFPEDHAVLWRDGNIIDLGTLPEGGYESGAQAVNSRGQVVGWAFNTIPDPYYLIGFTSLFSNFYQPIYPYQERAFFWQDGVMRDLGTLGTGTDALAMAINEPGQVIGISYTSPTANEITTPCSVGPSPTLDPFLWDKHSGMTDLGTLGGTCGFPSWINNSGQVVGQSDLAGDQTSHPFLWTKANGMQDLGTLGGNSGGADMINDFGVVVGGSTLANSQLDTFLWNGTMHDLGAIGGCGFAIAINVEGQVVGNWGSNVCAQGAFLWEDGGPMVDLSTLISNSAGLTALLVNTINDGGEIAGIGHFVDFGADGHAVLLIPCDENHPDIKGCDYRLVDGAAATRESSAPTMQEPATTPPRTLRPLGRRGLPFVSGRTGSLHGTLSVIDDAAHSPQIASRSGTGISGESCKKEGAQCQEKLNWECCAGLYCQPASDRAYCIRVSASSANISRASSFWDRVNANKLE